MLPRSLPGLAARTRTLLVTMFSSSSALTVSPLSLPQPNWLELPETETFPCSGKLSGPCYQPARTVTLPPTHAEWLKLF